MNHRHGRVRGGILCLAVLAAAGLGYLLWQHQHQGTSPSPSPSPFPLPAYSESRFLNTGPDAHYVGTAACVECHTANHRSYLLTSHSRALADLDPQTEPPDGTFHHKASGRTYRVYRKDNQFRHEEVLRTADGKEVSRVDLPIRYVIGSGSFCRTYLIEVDGFLHESPITWYTSKKNGKWDMSPGYDFAQHWSFERPIEAGCVACHAGRVEPTGGSVNRMTFHEKAIGCENCHGPGSLHLDLRRAKKDTPAGEDLTIVNPTRLSRSSVEAICAACHLNGPAVVPLRGRQVTDYRPGRPLTDYRIDYRFDSGNEQMTVVGHIEQLRQSACYQKSKSLTCLTCHDPHMTETPKDKTAFYRQKCLDCHTPQSCRLDEAQRRKKDQADNCMVCHMPRGDTEIPHVAFTHHRIGGHAPQTPTKLTRVPDLVPADDLPGLALVDQKRNLGLAYLQAFRNPVYAEFAVVHRERARTLLDEVQAAGLQEPAVAEGLAEIHWKQDPRRARDYARQAVNAKDAPAEVRAPALFLLADCSLQDRDFKTATTSLEELIRLRRYSLDWWMLGVAHQMQNDPRKALAALQQALAIRPTRPTIHQALAEVYAQLGDVRRAREHLEKAQWLLSHHQE